MEYKDYYKILGVAREAPQEEIKKLVRSCGNLYQRAERYDEAEAIFVKGGCFAPAAEVALRCGRKERAAELFLEAKDPQRAAEVLRDMGESERAPGCTLLRARPPTTPRDPGSHPLRGLHRSMPMR